jgi:hypothetical protein
LTDVTNLRSTPQSINSGVFSGTTVNSGTLKVPSSAVDAYKAATGWKEFKNIVGI